MASSSNEGAASAAPSLVLPDGASVAEIDRMEQAAVDAIEHVQDPDEAERLLREVTAAEHVIQLARVSAEREQRWAGLRLRAERRYGELLGPADRTKAKSDRLSDFEYQAQSKARRVAAVPAGAFDAYLVDNAKPTRSGLLRATSPAPTPRRSKTTTSPPDALDALRRRVKQVRRTDARVRPRWTLEDADSVELVLDNLLKRRPKYAGKRLRDLAAKRRNGGSDLVDLQYRVMQLTSILESVDVGSYDLGDPEEVGELHDDLVELQLWMDRSIALASARLDDAAFEAKIARMRDPSGRGEFERQTANALADKLERRRYDHRLEPAR